MSDFDWRNIPSFGEPSDIAGLYELIVDYAPSGSTLLEVGCYHGRSLVHLGLTAKAANKGLKVVGVDWGSDMSVGLAPEIRANVRRAGLEDTVELVIEDSTTAHRRLADGSVWFVFLDGRHDPHEAVAEDIRQWMPKVADDGFLAGHDYRWWTVCEPVNQLIPIVLYDPEWPDCWLAPRQSLIPDADIRKPTTIPKDLTRPTTRDFFKRLRVNP